MAPWLPLRAGTGSWGPLCWGTLSRAGAEPQSAARCTGAPKFKGRSLKSRICCSQARGAASPPHIAWRVLGCRMGLPCVPSPGASGSTSAHGCWGWHHHQGGCRGGGSGSCRALYSSNPSTLPWLRGQFGAGWTPWRRLAQVTGVCSMMVPMRFGRWDRAFLLHHRMPGSASLL